MCPLPLVTGTKPHNYRWRNEPVSKLNQREYRRKCKKKEEEKKLFTVIFSGHFLDVQHFGCLAGSEPGRTSGPGTLFDRHPAYFCRTDSSTLYFQFSYISKALNSLTATHDIIDGFTTDFFKKYFYFLKVITLLL